MTGGLGAFLYSNSQEPIYEAKATLLVQHRNVGSSTGVTDYRLSEQLASTYARQVEASPFLDAVLENNQLESFGSVNTRTSLGPPVLEILVQHEDALVARENAQIIADEFVDYVVEQRLAEIARLQAAAAARNILNAQDLVAAQFTVLDGLSILEPVGTPTSPILPRTRANIAAGAFLGLVLASGIALLLSSINDTVRNPDDLQRRYGITPLGTIFKWSARDAGPDELMMIRSPSSWHAESFRQVRANFQFATPEERGRSYMVTSPGPGDGKSTMIGNLAIALAQAGHRVLIIDADLRRPSVHRKFEYLNREPGLSNYLSNREQDFASITQATRLEGVSIVTGGPIPPNPAELLGSPRMSQLLAEATESADITLVDSPPVLAVSDSSILATQVDGAVITVDGLHTRWSSMHATVGALTAAKVQIVGVIINKLKRAKFRYGYRYPYYQYYEYYRTYSSNGGNEPSSNGLGPIYRKPIAWIKSVRLPSRPGNGPEA